MLARNPPLNHRFLGPVTVLLSLALLVWGAYLYHYSTQQSSARLGELKRLAEIDRAASRLGSQISKAQIAIFGNGNEPGSAPMSIELAAGLEHIEPLLSSPEEYSIYYDLRGAVAAFDQLFNGYLSLGNQRGSLDEFTASIDPQIYLLESQILRLRDLMLRESADAELAADMDIKATNRYLFIGLALFVPLAFFVYAYAQSMRRVLHLNGRLERSREQAEALMESSPVSTLVVDHQGEIYKANRKALELFGHTKENILQLEVEQLLPQDKIQSGILMDGDFFSNPSCVPLLENFPAKARLSSGDFVDVSLNLAPARFDDKLFTVISVRDMRTENVLKKSNIERQFRVDMASRVAQMGIFSGDTVSDFIHCEPGLMHLFDLPSGPAFVRKPEFLRVFHPEDRGRLESLLEEFGQSQISPTSIELRSNPDCGPLRYYSMTVGTADDETERYCGVCIDISASRRETVTSGSDPEAGQGGEEDSEKKSSLIQPRSFGLH